MIDPITQYLLEKYLISDKTISIDLDKFINGESNILVIAGLSGSGKSTLCGKLAKKYNAQCFQTDDCIYKVGKWERLSSEMPTKKELKSIFKKMWIQCMYPEIRKNKRMVVEGGAAWQGYILDAQINQVLKEQPAIILGTSALKSSWRAWKRKRPGRSSYIIRKVPTIIQRNFKLLQAQLDEFREERMKVGGEVKEFKLPRIKEN
jgi:shikimate kinase